MENRTPEQRKARLALAQHLYRTNPEYRKKTREYHREYDRTHPLTPEQKEQKNQRRRERYAANPQLRERDRAKRLAKGSRAVEHRIRKYGLEDARYKKMLNDQRGCCALCGEMPDRKTRHSMIQVDHDHETGAVRGLLCFPCNRDLGGYEKTLKRVGADAVNRYLSGWPQPELTLREAL